MNRKAGTPREAFSKQCEHVMKRALFQKQSGIDSFEQIGSVQKRDQTHAVYSERTFPDMTYMKWRKVIVQ